MVVDERLSNCWAYVKSIYPHLPQTSIVQAKKSKAMGEVAIFDYNGIEHYAVVEKMGYGTFTITESNFGSHKIQQREISFLDPHLKGFYSIASHSTTLQ